MIARHNHARIKGALSISFVATVIFNHMQDELQQPILKIIFKEGQETVS